MSKKGIKSGPGGASTGRGRANLGWEGPTRVVASQVVSSTKVTSHGQDTKFCAYVSTPLCIYSFQGIVLMTWSFNNAILYHVACACNGGSLMLRRHYNLIPRWNPKHVGSGIGSWTQLPIFGMGYGSGLGGLEGVG